MFLEGIEPIPIHSTLRPARLPTLAGAAALVAVVVLSMFAPIHVPLNLMSRYAAGCAGLAVAAYAGTHWLVRTIQRNRLRRTALRPPGDMPPPLSDAAIGELRRVWERLLENEPGSAWVLFTYGTCVLVRDGSRDVAAAAIERLATNGKAIPGTPSADMLVYYPIPGAEGVVVGGDHPDIYVFMSFEQTDGHSPPSASVLGRSARILDAFALEPAFVSPARHAIGE